MKRKALQKLKEEGSGVKDEEEALLNGGSKVVHSGARTPTTVVVEAKSSLGRDE